MRRLTIWRRLFRVLGMTKFEWREKRMNKQRRLRSGRVEPTILSRRETFFSNRFLRPKGKTSF